MIECIICGYLTIDQRGNYDICPVCFWEDGGGNAITEEEARKNYKEFGATEKRFVDKVRKPLESEKKDTSR